MNISGYPNQRRRGAAFTLIELIIVIAIIGILAALIIPVVGKVTEKRQIALAKTELQQLQSSIDEYKTKLGFYPPDNTNNPVTNQLYFELMGTTNNQAGTTPPSQWGTIDGSAFIDMNTPNISSFFFVSGFANTSTNLHSGDTGTAATTFLTGLRPTQIGVIDPQNKPLVKILVCSVAWPSGKQPYPIASNPILNPWRYNSSHPTNNVGTYDLWVDLVFGSKTNRICNWSPDPIKL